MTVTSSSEARPTIEPPVPEGHVRLTIDGRRVDAPDGEVIIRACERVGIAVPRFCEHPLLDPIAACRQCLVEVEMNGRAMPKPQPACAIAVAEGMVVKTQETSAVADKAQQGVMELLLVNHPLDCPICDKGGECPLQNQAMSHGRGDSRFRDAKRTFPKPIAISSQVLLDRERCVLCTRCTRFSEQIAGDPFIDMLERGPHQQVGTARTAEEVAWNLTGEGREFQSYFSGNTIQICPVGALTSTAYRFRSRPFDLVSTPTVCEHCASGCAQRTDHRRGKIMRRLAGDEPEVNEEWDCDKGRFGFRYVTSTDRLDRPMVRDGGSGELRAASWTEALQTAAGGLLAAREQAGVGILPGGRLTVEDAYAYGKFARVACQSNDVDFRARPHSAEEMDFLTARVLGATPATGTSFAAIEAAPIVLCVAFEPEEESPIVFLRLRKAAKKQGTRVAHIGQLRTPAVDRTSGELLRCPPGGEAAAVADIARHAPGLAAALREPGALVLVGERAATVPGLYSELDALAEDTGARVAWVPRRAGERGALEAGAAPGLLPGGRVVTDADARAAVEAAWRVPQGHIRSEPGRDTGGILAAATSGRLSALVIGGLDPADLADPSLAENALETVEFLVSLECRESAVTERADVVLPVAAAPERSGHYLNWEGRRREFGIALDGTGMVPDCRVLDTLAVEMDADLYTQTPPAAAGELSRLGPAQLGARTMPRVSPRAVAEPPPGRALLATWHQLLDDGTLQSDEPHLAGTRRSAVAALSAATAAGAGVADGEAVAVTTERGGITLPARIAALPDGVVWLPTNSGGESVTAALGRTYGGEVAVRAAARAVTTAEASA
jgi:NADH-quinone oxidoreductase subunit G